MIAEGNNLTIEIQDTEYIDDNPPEKKYFAQITDLTEFDDITVDSK